MTNLIPFSQRFIAGKSTRTVSARKLHEFLELKRDFSNWIKSRIEKYEFVENSDYLLTLAKNGELINRGLQGKTEYFITLDMAKELAMVERNEKGKQARRYFIDCEKKLIEKLKQEALPPAEEPPKLTLDDFIPDDDEEIASSLESLLYRSHKAPIGVRALICIDDGKATLVKQLTDSELIMDSVDIAQGMALGAELSEHYFKMNEKYNIDLYIIAGAI